MNDKIQNLQLYNLKEVAELLSVTERTLHNYLKAGTLKGVKIGGKWKISEENLKRFVNGDQAASN